MHARPLHSPHTHESCLPPSICVSSSLSLPLLGPPPRSCRSLECPSKYARVPGAENNVGASEYRSAPCQLCQIRGRGGCRGGGDARGNINMPPFTPHTLTLFPPPSPSLPLSLLPCLPPSLTLARTYSSPPRPRSHMGGRKGRKKRREERNAGTTAPRGREENELGQRTAAPGDREGERAGRRRQRHRRRHRAVRLGHA